MQLFGSLDNNLRKCSNRIASYLSRIESHLWRYEVGLAAGYVLIGSFHPTGTYYEILFLFCGGLCLGLYWVIIGFATLDAPRRAEIWLMAIWTLTSLYQLFIGSCSMEISTALSMGGGIQGIVWLAKAFHASFLLVIGEAKPEFQLRRAARWLVCPGTLALVVGLWYSVLPLAYKIWSSERELMELVGQAKIGKWKSFNDSAPVYEDGWFTINCVLEGKGRTILCLGRDGAVLYMDPGVLPVESTRLYRHIYGNWWHERP